MSAAKHDDPRDSSLEAKFSSPKTWFLESSAGLNTSGMFLSGLIMVTRNRLLAWPAILFALNGVINQHPMRTKEGDSNGYSSLLLCVSALFASYLPFFIITNPAA